MDLHSGIPFWQTTYLDAPTYPSLEEDIDCDVVIIGGGCSGAHCAHYLSQFDMNIVLVDKRRVGLGSSVVNTALLQYIGDKMFHQLTNSFGEETAVRHIKLCRTAMEEVEKLARTIHKNPHYERRDSLFFASSKEDVQKLEKEYKLLKKHQFPVEWLTEQEIYKRYSFKKPAAITTLNDGEINPYIYIHGLIRKAAKRGVRVFEQTEINGKKFAKQETTLYTKNKKSIRAKYVIFAAGYEGLEFKNERNTTIESSYAVFTNQLKEEDFSPWYKRSLIWETARPYLYIRTTKDNRVVIGGLDEPTAKVGSRDARIEYKKDALIREFNKLFPKINVHAEYYYGAFYGGTHDGLPIVGMYEDLPNCYFLLSFGDNGLVYSNVLSKVIGDDIIFGSSPNMPIYLHTRPLRH